MVHKFFCAICIGNSTVTHWYLVSQDRLWAMWLLASTHCLWPINAITVVDKILTHLIMCRNRQRLTARVMLVNDLYCSKRLQGPFLCSCQISPKNRHCVETLSATVPPLAPANIFQNILLSPRDSDENLGIE